MVMTTMRARTTTKRMKVKSLSLWYRHPSRSAEPLGKKHKKRRGKGVTVGPASLPFPKAEWEGYGSLRRIAFTTWMSREVPAKEADYSYQEIFSEGANLAAGHVQLEPGADKSSKDNSCVFFPLNDVWSTRYRE